jgi:hypothetical protein
MQDERRRLNQWQGGTHIEVEKTTKEGLHHARASSCTLILRGQRWYRSSARLGAWLMAIASVPQSWSY